MKFNGKKQGGAAAAGLSSGAQASPCAACKLLRRKCAAGDCVFAPHFPPHDPSKFANVHKVFGASNVNKMLQVRDLIFRIFFIMRRFSGLNISSKHLNITSKLTITPNTKFGY